MAALLSSSTTPVTPTFACARRSDGRSSTASSPLMTSRRRYIALLRLAAECLFGRRNLPVGGCCAPDSPLEPDVPRCRSATGGEPGGRLLSENWTEQRGGGSGALLDDTCSEQHRNEEEDRCARPGSIPPGRGGKAGKERHKRDS